MYKDPNYPYLFQNFDHVAIHYLDGIYIQLLCDDHNVMYKQTTLYFLMCGAFSHLHTIEDSTMMIADSE